MRPHQHRPGDMKYLDEKNVGDKHLDQEVWVDTSDTSDMTWCIILVSVI